MVRITNSISHSDMPSEYSAGCVLYRLDDDGARSYLLVHHRNGEHWGFPKGKIERGESEKAAACRETVEETGIEPERIDTRFRIKSSYRFNRGKATVEKYVTYFIAPAGNGTLSLSEEHIGASWMSYESAHATLTYHESCSVLEEAERLLAERRS